MEPNGDLLHRMVALHHVEQGLVVQLAQPLPAIAQSRLIIPQGGRVQAADQIVDIGKQPLNGLALNRFVLARLGNGIEKDPGKQGHRLRPLACRRK